MNPVTDGTNGKPQQKNSIEFISAWDINAAMRDLYDLTEMASLPYVLLGDAARQLYDGKDGFNNSTLQVDKLEWGMFEKNLTPEVQSLFRAWNFETWEDKGFKYKFENVPVYVRVLTKKWKFFELPDMRFYGPDFFKIPNPFERYWKSRFIIK